MSSALPVDHNSSIGEADFGNREEGRALCCTLNDSPGDTAGQAVSVVKRCIKLSGMSFSRTVNSMFTSCIVANKSDPLQRGRREWLPRQPVFVRQPRRAILRYSRMSQTLAPLSNSERLPSSAVHVGAAR